MLKRHTSPTGLALLKSFEGIGDGNPATVNLDPYLDPCQIWTIGWGHALRHGSRLLKGAADRALALALFPAGITLAQAGDLLVNDVAPCEIYLRAVFPSLTQNQFDALVSFCFNIGLGAFERSTMFVLLKRQRMLNAAEQFRCWNKGHDAAGHLIEIDGLERRRASERALFLQTVAVA